MPITFRCTCGKTMQAKEEHAGARCKCVGCGATLLIPQMPTVSMPPPSVPAPPSRPPAPPSPLTLPPSGIQTAGTQPASMSPKTDALRTLPYQVSSAPPTAVPPPPPSAPTERDAMQPYPWPDREIDEMPWYQVDPRQARRRRKRGLLIAASAIALVVVLLIGGVLFFVLRSGPAPGLAQLNMVPRDAPYFFTLRVADLWAAKALDKTRTDLGPRLNAFLGKELGLKIEDVDRLTLVLAEIPEVNPAPRGVPDMWIVVHTRSLLDKNRVRDSLIRFPTEKTIKHKLTGQEAILYTSWDTALHFPGDKELWLGKPETLESLLSGDRTIAMEGPLKESIDLAAKNEHHLVTALHLPEASKKQLEANKAVLEIVRPFLDMTGGFVAFNADADKGGDLVALLKFTKAESAHDAAAFIRLALVGAKDQLQKVPAGNPEEARIIEQTMKLVDRTKVEDVGSDVVLTVSGASDILGPMLDAVIPQMEREFRRGPVMP